MTPLLIPLLFSLVLTLAVELTLAFLLKVRAPKDLLVVALANLLTNPLVNYAYYWAIYFFTSRSLYTYLILAALELAAVLVEFLIYRMLLSYDRIKKLLLSVILNAASFLSGILVTLLLRLAS